MYGIFIESLAHSGLSGSCEFGHRVGFKAEDCAGSCVHSQPLTCTPRQPFYHGSYGCVVIDRPHMILQPCCARRVTNFLSHAVISGFTSGAAIIIGLSQVRVGGWVWCLVRHTCYWLIHILFT
jgi:hypothetical protein